MNAFKTASTLLLTSLFALTGCGSSDTTGGPGSTGEPTELKFDQGADEPRFSPDGATIAFVQANGTSGDTDLAVMTPAGEQRKVLGPAGGYLSGPAWSPDGKQIYFASNDGISVIPAAGGTATVVVMDFATLDPDASADGKSLVYATNGGDLKFVDLANPATPKDLATTGSSPRFSPDGKTIAFEDGEKIKTLDLATSKVTEVVDGGTYLASLDWFPDGNRLAITSDKGIEIVTLGASAKRTLVRDEFAAKNIDVSTDGKSMAYAVNGSKNLFILTGF